VTDPRGAHIFEPLLSPALATCLSALARAAPEAINAAGSGAVAGSMLALVLVITPGGRRALGSTGVLVPVIGSALLGLSVVSLFMDTIVGVFTGAILGSAMLLAVRSLVLVLRVRPFARQAVPLAVLAALPALGLALLPLATAVTVAVGSGALGRAGVVFGMLLLLLWRRQVVHGAAAQAAARLTGAAPS